MHTGALAFFFSPSRACIHRHFSSFLLVLLLLSLDHHPLILLNESPPLCLYEQCCYGSLEGKSPANIFRECTGKTQHWYCYPAPTLLFFDIPDLHWRKAPPHSDEEGEGVLPLAHEAVRAAVDEESNDCKGKG